MIRAPHWKDVYMNRIFLLMAGMIVVAGSLCASTAKAYQFLERHFDVTPLRADIYVKVRCDDGRILKLDPNANVYEACEEGPYAPKEEVPAASKP
jgi:hypothetical protein